MSVRMASGTDSRALPPEGYRRTGHSGRKGRPGPTTKFVLLLVVTTLVISACGILNPFTGAPDYGKLTVSANSAQRKAEQATVRIRTLGCNALSTGSGVIVGPKEMLTNAHVIAGAEKVDITLWNGTTVSAKVVGANQSEDLARVQVDADLTEKGATVATLSGLDPVDGSELLAFGFPGGKGFAVLRGQLLGYFKLEDQPSFRMSNQVVQGNSGGPVFSANGLVVGIVRAKAVESGDGIAIPISIVKPALQQMRTSPPGRPPSCGAFAQK